MVFDSTKKMKLIGMITAMDEELEAILSLIDNPEKEIYNKIHIYKGILNDQNIIVCKSGVGKVQAAMATTILITYFKADIVINVGIAGSLHKEVSLENVVIADKVAQWDFDLTAFNEMKGFANPRYTFEVSNILLDKLKKRLLNEQKVVFGPMVTGDQFVYQSNQIENIKDTYKEALCVDMEAGAIAQICSFLNIPFLIIRTISDIVDNDKSEETYEQLIIKASNVAAKYTRIVIEALFND
ncbi:MAG: 5'-methylthioadenosine/adenosylhomocysteine nucleosidase [Erysipelotrichaceae bacterium]|nr:5'-methylthioadenosine/adenosylhomocysteine nucleosidase [Erysipelotrichaceae bacterium]MDD4642165.1 5'-methylthioadenosine/adenosylhomocysteine nucleosidase [Erysipelotrichaceae bacterium]